MLRKKTVWLLALTLASVLPLATRNAARTQQPDAPKAAPAGIFESHGDIGTVLHAGSVEYDAAKGSYAMAASGENMWSTKDAFQFVWKKMSGDITLIADISFVGKSAQEHRKAVLMVRQSLDADSPYADVTLHGNGMPALQYRDEKGALTHEVQAATWSPKRLRLEKRGAFFTLAAMSMKLCNWTP